MSLPVHAALFTVLVITASGRRLVRSTQECDTTQFANLDACCETPHLFSSQLLKFCIDDLGRTKPGETVPDFQDHDIKTETQDFSSGAAGPMIVIDCMFRNLSLVTRSGHVDVGKMMTSFLTASDSKWRPVMENAFTTCTRDIAKLKTKDLPEASLVNVGPAFFVACLRREMFMYCPEESMLNAAADCRQKIDEVSKCSPYTLGSKSEGGSGGWMGTILRWIAGPQTWGEKSVKPTGSNSFFWNLGGGGWGGGGGGYSPQIGLMFPIG